MTEHLRQALADSPFPELPSEPIPAGSSVRTLTVEENGQRESTYVGWSTGRKLPGYAELFAMLDSLVRQMSGDVVRAAPDILPPSVSALAQMQ